MLHNGIISCSQTVAAFFCVSKFPTCTGCQVLRKRPVPPIHSVSTRGKRRARAPPRRYCWRRFGPQRGPAGVGAGIAYKFLSFWVLPVGCIRRDQRRIIPSTSFLVNDMFGPQTAVVGLFSTQKNSRVYSSEFNKLLFISSCVLTHFCGVYTDFCDCYCGAVPEARKLDNLTSATWPSPPLTDTLRTFCFLLGKTCKAPQHGTRKRSKNGSF